MGEVDLQRRIGRVEDQVGTLREGFATITGRIDGVAVQMQAHTDASAAANIRIMDAVNELRDELQAERDRRLPVEITETKPPDPPQSPADWVKENWIAIVVGILVLSLVVDIMRGDVTSEQLMRRLDRMEQQVEADGVTLPDTSPLEFDVEPLP